jgi:hypothetical protein
MGRSLRAEIYLLIIQCVQEDCRILASTDFFKLEIPGYANTL